MLQLKGVTGGYREGNPILNGIDLTVEKNEVVAIVGQNGAGKSTLAKAIMNMIPFLAGEIYYRGELLKGKNTQAIIHKGLNFFLQGGRIFPNLTVEENLDFAGAGTPKNEVGKLKMEIKSYFNLFKESQTERLKMKASYLSGGEQHQLALAMVMIKRPKFLILDEPSAGLSPGNTKQIYQILKQIKEQKMISILLIEQNVDQAVNFADRILLLENGKIEREKRSQEFKNLKELDIFFFGKF